MSWWAPSASATSCRARSTRRPRSRHRARSSRPTVDARGAGGRAARRCRWSTCSRRSRAGRRSSRSPPRSASSRSAAVDDGVGGDHDEHRGQRRARACRRPWPCRRPTSRRAARPRSWRTVSVVMIASAASGPPSVASAGRRGVDAGQQEVHRQPLADQAGRADDDVARRRRRATAPTCSAVRWVSWKPGAPVQALAPPELSTTASDPAVGDDLRDQMTGAASTRLLGEHGGRVVVGAVVDDEGDVGAAGGLQAGGDAGGPEAARGGDGHQEVPPVSEVGVMTRPARRQAVGGGAGVGDRARAPSRCRRSRTPSTEMLGGGERLEHLGEDAHGAERQRARRPRRA